eukprot:13758604-Ditylum_brightwellii.AAC.1
MIISKAGNKVWVKSFATFAVGNPDFSCNFLRALLVRSDGINAVKCKVGGYDRTCSTRNSASSNYPSCCYVAPISRPTHGPRFESS